ncbi:MAG: amino acid permease [Acidobacteriota bacterium]|nr:MAG: amino acid permease [Acidobacteriota bacterium]
MQENEDRSRPRLTRALGLTDCTMLVVGAIIGSGIFLTPSIIARTVQNVESVLLIWIAGGILTFCGAVSYAELGAMYPEAGGIYVFLAKCYGKLVAFLFGWCFFLVILPGAIATLANAFAIYTAYLVGIPLWGAKLLAVVLVLVLTTLNCLGIKAGARTQNLLTVIKVASLIGIACVLFIFDHSAPNVAAGEGEVPGFPPIAAIGVAMIAVLWSYDGWHLVTSAAGEVRNPGRNFTGGLLLGTAIVAALYLLVNLAYLHMLSFAEITASAQVASAAMERAIGPSGGFVVAIAIVLSISGAMNSNILGGPRVPFAMALDGLFFRKVAYVSPRYHVPTAAIVMVGCVASILTWVGTFEVLFNAVIFVSWIFYGLGAAAVIVLRKRDPLRERPYRAWGYPVVPITFALAALALVINNIVNNFGPSVGGLTVVATGLPAYYFWSRRLRRVVPTEAVGDETESPSETTCDSA